MNANDLLGTRHNPVGFDQVRSISRTAKAYHALAPYPFFSAMTKNWKTEERGPYPVCRPFVQRVVTKGARWLFGKPINWRAESEAGTKLLNETWTANSMTARAQTLAIWGALCGGVAVKWSFDKEDGARIHILDAAEQCRFYWDQDDIKRLLMVRMQYPSFDQVKGEWSWYREDWTDTDVVIYEPLSMGLVASSQTINDPYQFADLADRFDGWKEASRKPNPFGVIPFWYIHNSVSGGTFGEGDLWPFYAIVDQINFTRDLGHKDNQRLVDPGKAYIDLVAADEDAPGNTGPGSEQVLQTREEATTQGKVAVLESNGTYRPHIKEHADDLLRELLDAVGDVGVDPEEITNKGNLTSAVLTQLYGPLIDRTEGKRTNYGEDGLCVFFERMSKGLVKVRAPGWSEIQDAQIVWPEFWEKPEDEKMALATRQAFLYENRFTTQDRAIQAVATADGVIDVDALKQEIEKEPGPAREAGETDNGKTKPEDK